MHKRSVAAAETWCHASSSLSGDGRHAPIGDYEGGRRKITRFYVTPRTHASDDEAWLWLCSTSRHWNLDRDDPAEGPREAPGSERRPG